MEENADKEEVTHHQRCRAIRENSGILGLLGLLGLLDDYDLCRTKAIPR